LREAIGCSAGQNEGQQKNAGESVAEIQKSLLASRSCSTAIVAGSISNLMARSCGHQCAEHGLDASVCKKDTTIFTGTADKNCKCFGFEKKRKEEFL
jgi:hypothetical protein